jgi:hypothetical protein
MLKFQGGQDLRIRVAAGWKSRYEDRCPADFADLSKQYCSFG